MLDDERADELSVNITFDETISPEQREAIIQKLCAHFEEQGFQLSTIDESIVTEEEPPPTAHLN